MGKSNFQTFLKRYDRFAKNVSLSYKRSGSFETSIGGVCSIFIFTLLTYWLAVNVWDTFAPPGKFSTKRKTERITTSNGTYPELEVPLERLFQTYRIFSLDETIKAANNTEDYMIGLWFQQDYDQTLKAYLPIPCEQVEELALLREEQYFENQIAGQLCPDMKGEPMVLQNTINGDWIEGQTFHFAVDTCENFQKYTGSTTCKSNDVVEPLIQTFVVTTKLSFKFFSSTTYAENNFKSTSTFEPATQPLSSSFLTHKSWSIVPEHVSFMNWWVYSDQLINKYEEFNIYAPRLSDAWSYPSADKDKIFLPEPKNSYFSYTFHQAQIKDKTTSVRSTFYDVFRSFGSLLSFSIRFIVLGISQMQSFSLANSLIKKLYSVNEQEEQDGVDGFDALDASQKEEKSKSVTFVQEMLDEDSNSPDKEIRSYSLLSNEMQEQGKVKKEIESRETFSYKYKRFWLLKKFESICCCCCNPKQKRDDFLFKDAKSKLSEEIDVLEIVKKLRVHQFASQISLKPHQRDLVNFFQDYKLVDPQAEQAKQVITVSDSHISVKNGRGDDHNESLHSAQDRSIFNVDEQVNNNDSSNNATDNDEVTDKAISQLYKSISKLDPLNDEVDAKIIARVTNSVRRKRDKDGRTQMLSAQEVRQDMKILKKIRQSKGIGGLPEFGSGARTNSDVLTARTGSNTRWREDNDEGQTDVMTLLLEQSNRPTKEKEKSNRTSIQM